MLLGLAVLASAQAAPQIPASNAGTTVRVMVTIASAGHTPVKADVSAFVDGRPAQVIEVASAKDQQLIFAVLIDVSGSSRDKQAFEKKSSLELFRALRTGENTGYFGDFDDELYFEKKPATIESINVELKRIGVFRGGTAFYDAVFRATQFVGRAPGQQTARRALFVLTDGDDTASKRSLEGAIQEAQRQGVTVFCIGLQASKKGAAGIRTLSAATGATALFLTRPDDYIQSLLQVLQDQFWITLALPAAGDNKLHTVTLASSDTDARISAPTHILVH
jgi:hypothetical protein